jgi:hypothetical protein
MTASLPFTVHRSPLSMRYQFTVIHEATQLIANGKCMVNSKWLRVNGAGECHD